MIPLVFSTGVRKPALVGAQSTSYPPTTAVQSNSSPTSPLAKCTANDTLQLKLTDNMTALAWGSRLKKDKHQICLAYSDLKYGMPAEVNM